MTPTGERPGSVRVPARGLEVTLPTDRQRFLAAIVESAEDAILAKSLDGRILSWNAGAERMYGYRPDEIVGDYVYRLAPRDRRAEIDSILARLRRGERIEPFETVRVRRDGERFPVSLTISPVRDADGAVVGASTIARDITEQRRLAESASLQKSLLVAQAEASLDGILVVDPDGEVIFRNARYVGMWSGSVAGGAFGTHAAELERARGQVLDPDAYAQSVTGLDADPVTTSRDQVWLRDGRVFDRFSAPVLGADGRHYGRVWYFRDTTAETTMNARLRAVIAAIDDIAFVCAADGTILLRNRAAAQLLPGVETEDQILGAIEATPDSSSANAAAPEFQLLGGRNRRWVRLSRHPIPLHARAETRGGPEVGQILLLRDITEVRDMQASQEAFSGILSHELRTPITTILGAAKMLGRVRGAAARELLDDIGAEADRLYRLVEDLLVLTRVERGSLSMTDDPVLVGRIVERVIAAERGGLQRQRFEVEIERDLPIVRGDDTYLEQLLRNLVGNALKYGPPDGTVRVIAERGEASVRIRVIDDGPGIRPGEHERVFDLLYRSPATEAQAAGSGVGLFVSRRLAETMGGRIWAEARNGPGAELVVELPLYDDRVEPEDEAGAGAVAASSPNGTAPPRRRPAPQPEPAPRVPTRRA